MTDKMHRLSLAASSEILGHHVENFRGGGGWMPLQRALAKLLVTLFGLSELSVSLFLCGQTVEAKNMADFWRIMTQFDVISMATAKGSNR